jgi:hypothetical protein
MVSGSRWSRKAVFAVATVAILALSFSATAAFGAGAVPFKDAHFSGYATGTVLHADALQTSGTRLVDVEEAFTGSAVRSDGLTPRIKNEMDREVTPAAPGKKSQGRGSGVEVGLVNAPPDTEPNALILTSKSESLAPPSTNLDTQDITPLPANPLVYASLLRGQSQALWAEDQCIVGRDISFGRGHAADVQLLSQTLSNVGDTPKLDQPLVATDSSINDPERAVASSYSHEFLDVQRNATGHPIGLAFGLTSEARMTIAPITLFKGTPQEITLEFAGEWVLRAVAGGIPGSAFIHYGPGAVSPSTPILRLIQNGAVQDIVTLQDITGALGMDTGINITIPGLLELSIGENPRAIGGAFGTDPAIDKVNGTSAAAAVDVVRIKILNTDAATHVADIRLGHMEVKTQVPAGGIDCGIPVTKSASPRGVTVNQSFVVTIKIDNPFGCDLTGVKVVDAITTKGDAKFQVVGTNPTANTVPAGSNLDSGTIIWNNIGSIPKGGTKSVTATVKAQGGGGEIDDIANVSAVLGNCQGQGEGNQMVGKSIQLRVPVVLKLKLPPTGVGTSTATFLGALALISLAGVGIRQLRRTTI